MLNNLKNWLFVSLAVIGLNGCQSIPPEQLKNYALIESRIGSYSGDMDKRSPSSMESVAYISYVDGRSRMGGASMDVAPGEYRFQVGLRCENTATCRPSDPYVINVEAGKRYVLKPRGEVYVSDRFSSRAGEVRYQSK